MLDPNAHLQTSDEDRQDRQVKYLDRALWIRFQDTQSNTTEFPKAWLALQCSMISGVVCACVVLKQEQQYKPVAFWPETLKQTPSLNIAAENAMREKKGVLISNKNTSSLALPLLVNDAVLGVAALEVASESDSQLSAVMRQLQWGISWLENHFVKKIPQESREKHQRLAMAFQLSSLCLEHQQFTSAAFAVATEWAVQLGCERVAIGFRKPGASTHAQVVALSHNSHFDKRTNGVRMLGNAMDEAIDQRKSIQFPVAGSMDVIKAHELLLSESGNGSVCTIPLIRSGKADGEFGVSDEIIGAVTLEHHEADYFNAKNLALCNQIALVVGPLLETKRTEDRWIFKKLWESIHAEGKRLIGTGHYGYKLTTLALLALISFFTFFESTYRVSSDATIEGWTQRHISAPIDGYIADSKVRAGDLVEQGQLLFTFDSRDLKLEQLKWSGKREQVEKQYLDALVQRELAKVGVFQAQLMQAKAELDLISEQLARTEVIAPFTGVVVKGDLSQKLGAPVEKGESLMQIAPLDSYRIILEVDERDVSDIKVGQIGELGLAAIDDETFSFSVEKLTPVSSAEEGVNRFRIEAKLDKTSELLRPGMEGNGKVVIGERNLFWILTHSLADWVRIWLWSWWP